MKIEWDQFEKFTTDRGLDVLMIEDSDYYYLSAAEFGFVLNCNIDKNSSDRTVVDHFESSHKSKCNPKKNDTENTQLVRLKYCSLGWSYLSKTFEIQTSVINSLVTQNYNAACSSITAKFLKYDFTEITSQEDADLYCTITQVDFYPAWSYELLGGRMRQVEIPTEAVRMFIRAAPDIPSAFGGSKDFVTNYNLQYLGQRNELITDGRASKTLSYIQGTDANKIRFWVKHPAGFKHKMQITLELFRA